MNRSRLVVLAIGGLIGLITFTFSATLEEARSEAEAAKREAGRLREELAETQQTATAIADAVARLIATIQRDHDSLLRAIRNDEPVIVRVPIRSDPPAESPPPRNPKGKKSGKEEPPPKRPSFLRQLICLLIPFC